MNEGPVFNIGEQHAGRDIIHIAGDMIINQNSSIKDVLKIIQAIQQKSSELDIDDKNKKEIKKHIETVKIELEDKNPDKKSIEESIRRTNEIIGQAKTMSENLKDIGILIGKIAMWLGTTTTKLGWMF